ncbi:hypothetical protein JRO89_XSUnG0004700 [Xanthoceras sorbifolium]|uniref:Uncharacterized protein n=1 Tax=Xanthoceras sorbifolium TaxID=99658 RepID=A0ABQ8H0D0_9ROSI|nr:hypothetical protein JRO89_XSUnG0004700 [Xanthoceras sorbifolium]
MVFGHKVVRYLILTILITFFTGYSINYHLVKAARLVNILEGLTASLIIVVAYMSDALFSPLKILSCSVLLTIGSVYVMFRVNQQLFLQGLLIFYLNLRSQGNYEILYITGILLLAMGEAGLRPLLNEFFIDQLREHEPDTNTDDDGVEDEEEAHVEDPLENRVDDDGVEDPAEAHMEDPTEDQADDDVVEDRADDRAEEQAKDRASLLKRQLNYPSSPDLFFQNYGNQTNLSPRLKILRWLDKAAIIESSNLRPEQQERAGRLCTVTQVEESKLLLKMIPMWSTFIVIGLAESTGDTFSSEQGKNLDSTDFTFYMVIFVKPISQATISFLFNKFLTSKKGASNSQLKLGKIMRMWSGMVLCIIFCVVAWRVEVYRLQIVDRKRNNPEIPNMSIFWLAPQYCLLGLMQGSGINGLDEFMIVELPKSLKNYASAMNGFVVDGIGNFLGILFVYANRQLFSATMNESRLDKYYFRLMILSFLNMVYYFLISIIYIPIRYNPIR